jgi:transcriptional regulator with XRE-family HTH domain
MRMPATNDNPLGTFLKDRRTRLDPVALGYPSGRRRTPGLRREEVAQRAHVSATWYTFLEQGRGGPPSTEVLERIASALMLNNVEREHLFLLAQNRPPALRYQESDGVTPRLQRILDAMESTPALVRTVTWDVIAWNRAAAKVLTDYGALPPKQRNVLRMMFLDPKVRAAQLDWESVARSVVAVFRADASRAGASARMTELSEELSAASSEFAAMWRDNDVGRFGEGIKQIRHPQSGLIAFEYSSFAVDGRPDLGMVVFNPATPDDVEKVRALLAR